MIQRADDWKVGLFVVGVLTAGVLGLLALGARGLSRPTIDLVAFFDESIEGMSVGTPVKFRGVTIGEVGSIRFAEDRRHVRVGIEAYVDAIGGLGLADDAEVLNASQQLESRGIRLRIQRSALTGFTYLEADVFDPSSRPQQQLPFEKPFNFVPTEPSTLKSLEDDLQSTLAEFPELVRSILRVVNEISAALDDMNMAETSARFNAVLARAETKLGAIDMQAVDQLVRELREVATAIDRDALARSTGALDDLTTRAGRVLDGLESETQHLGSAIESTRGAADVLRAELEAAEVGPTAAALRRAADALAQLSEDGARATERAGPVLRELERALAAVTALARRLEREPSSVLFGPAPADDSSR